MMRALLLWLLLASPALALDPERREVVVVSGRVWDGFQFTEMFLPSDRAEMTLMAGEDSVITFVRTQEYYWPLSRQVYVDFERQKEGVAGKLQIEQDGRVVSEIEPLPYVIEYPQGAVNGNGRLLWGDAALAAHAAYVQEERDFNRRFVEAQRAEAAYERALLDAARAGSTDPVEAPAAPPKPSLRLVTQPAAGFRVALAPGAYRMSLLSDGRVVPGTERGLQVIAAEGSAALVADILPEERWTRPLPSNSTASRIYARAGSTFYLTLAEASRFRETDYLAVVSPQASPVPGRDIWVRRRSSEVQTLETTADGGSLGRDSFKVEQTSSSGFGYTVRPVRPGETADIEAFAVLVPEGPGRLVIESPAAGFTREVIAVGDRNSMVALLSALLPILGFGVSHLFRRRAAG